MQVFETRRKENIPLKVRLKKVYKGNNISKFGSHVFVLAKS